MDPFGSLLKAMACVTELTRAVQVLNTRLEAHTNAVDRLATQGENVERELRELKTMLKAKG